MDMLHYSQIGKKEEVDRTDAVLLNDTYQWCSVHLVCNQCPYGVVVTSFDPNEGNIRTQAAATIDRCAAVVNHRS